jgi:hypothetical protein
MEGPKSRQKEDITNGRVQGEQEEIKFSTSPLPPLSKGASGVRKGEEHLKKQLAKKNSHL